MGKGFAVSVVLVLLLSSGTFGAVDNLEGYPGAFFKRFEALSLNRGMMNKDITAAILLDKTKTF